MPPPPPPTKAPTRGREGARQKTARAPDQRHAGAAGRGRHGGDVGTAENRPRARPTAESARATGHARQQRGRGGGAPLPAARATHAARHGRHGARGRRQQGQERWQTATTRRAARDTPTGARAMANAGERYRPSGAGRPTAHRRTDRYRRESKNGREAATAIFITHS